QLLCERLRREQGTRAAAGRHVEAFVGSQRAPRQLVVDARVAEGAARTADERTGIRGRQTAQRIVAAVEHSERDGDEDEQGSGAGEHSIGVDRAPCTHGASAVRERWCHSSLRDPVTASGSTEQENSCPTPRVLPWARLSCKTLLPFRAGHTVLAPL